MQITESSDGYPARSALEGCASEEGGDELVVVVGPPAAPALVALAATGPVPHRGDVRVTGVDAAPAGRRVASRAGPGRSRRRSVRRGGRGGPRRRRGGQGQRTRSR